MSSSPRRAALAAALVALSASGVPGQQQPIPVARGASVERRIAPGAVDSFALRLDAPSFVLGDADQRDVDVVVTVLDPDGRQVLEVDGPARGPERFFFSAEKPGTYRVRVRPFGGDSGGTYVLRLPRVERLATTPAGKVDQLLAQYDGDSPGAAVGVVRGGKLIFAKGYGRASLEFAAPITPRTPFHVASVSKQFTAFGVVLLARDGKLSIDDDVRKHIPELPDLGQTITLRHLLNHTSGVRDHWDLWGMSGGRMDDVITQDDIFRLVTRQKALNFRPGAEFLYSNSGYMLLAKVIERVGGKPFPQFMRERVFEPLGMRDTRVHDDHGEIVPGRAYSYGPGDRGGYQNSVLSYANSGATSLFTTVEDLAKWLDNFRTTTVGGAAARDMLWTRGIRTNGDTISYALGVTVDTYRQARRVQHGGADAGFRSFVAWYPEHDVGVIVLGNLGTFDAGGTANRVAEAFLGDALGPAPTPAAAPVRAVAASVTVDPARLEPLTGEFASTSTPFSFTVTRDRDQIFVQAPGQQRLPVRATSDSTFRADAVNAELTFLRRGAGVDTVRLAQNGTQTLVRRTPYVASASDMSSLAGRYYSTEVDAAVELIADGAKLTLRRRHTPDVTLGNPTRDRFTGPWPINTLRVERDASGKPTALLVSSGRVRNVRFVRQDPPA